MVPFNVVLDKLLTELGAGLTNPEATRVAVPIFLESGAMFGGACKGVCVRVRPVLGPWEIAAAAQWSVKVRGESRQVYFRAELGFLEGTPLCPCLIQNYLPVRYRANTGITAIVL